MTSTMIQGVEKTVERKGAVHLRFDGRTVLISPKDYPRFAMAAEKAVDVLQKEKEREEVLRQFQEHFLPFLHAWCVAHGDKVQSCYLGIPTPYGLCQRRNNIRKRLTITRPFLSQSLRIDFATGKQLSHFIRQCTSSKSCELTTASSSATGGPHLVRTNQWQAPIPVSRCHAPGLSDLARLKPNAPFSGGTTTMLQLNLDPIGMLRPRRRITGVSAVLLPFAADGSIDWPAFLAHVVRTAEAGLTPAVNMDTGYVNLLDAATRRHILNQTQAALGNQPFMAGAFVSDRPDASFDRDAYLREIELIQHVGGTPVIFQSYGLTGQADEDIVMAYAQLGRHCDRFIGFELGTMFAPFGKIYSLEVYRGLLSVPSCIGAKHSSLRRDLEWQRLAVRDAVRAEFRVFTGNDLAIDMVMYGSDYLLGLSTFAPDLFARRDALWAAGDPAFHELNDVLQYLGFLAFRAPVPAYKHSAAMFLKMRGWIASDLTHPSNPGRPGSDRAILREIGRQLGLSMAE